MKSTDYNKLILLEYFRSNSHDFNRDVRFTIIETNEDTNIISTMEKQEDKWIKHKQMSHLDLIWDFITQPWNKIRKTKGVTNTLINKQASLSGTSNLKLALPKFNEKLISQVPSQQIYEGQLKTLRYQNIRFIQ